MTPATEQLLEQLVTPDPREGAGLEALQRHVDEILCRDQVATLVGAGGETVETPRSALHALQLIVAAMVRGQTVTLVPHGRELTSQEAADILHVSRPHLVKLLDEGDIPHYRVGTHRRVRIEDVLSYRRRRAATRRERLDELARLSEELEGGYR